MSSKDFAIISSQRSGSTMLVHILDQHPELLCAGEIFKRQDTQLILHPEYSFDLPSRQRELLFKLAPSNAITAHLKKCSSGQERVFGFKLMTSQMETCPSIAKVLEQLGFASIVLIRENVVEQSLSLELARAYKKWTNDASSDEPIRQVKINLESLDKTIRFFTKAREQLRALGSSTDTLLVEYQQLMHNRTASLKQITDHLCIRSEFDYELSLRPSSELSYADHISNFNEIERYFSSMELSL